MREKVYNSELGFVNTRDMFKHSFEGGYPAPAHNLNNMEQLQATISGCVDTNSPVIFQVTGSARNHTDSLYLTYMAKVAAQMAKSSG